MELSPLTDETKRLLDALPTKETSTNQEVYSWGKVTAPRAPRAHFAHLTSAVRPFLKRKMG
jgi:hypothetical protein